LKTKNQKWALFCILLMSALGLFGDYMPVQTEGGQEHVEIEKRIAPTTRGVRTASGGASGAGAGGGGDITGQAAITLPRLRSSLQISFVEASAAE
jgi:hypothetical protein